MSGYQIVQDQVWQKPVIEILLGYALPLIPEFLVTGKKKSELILDSKKEVLPCIVLEFLFIFSYIFFSKKVKTQKT